MKKQEGGFFPALLTLFAAFAASAFADFFSSKRYEWKKN